MSPQIKIVLDSLCVLDSIIVNTSQDTVNSLLTDNETAKLQTFQASSYAYKQVERYFINSSITATSDRTS